MATWWHVEPERILIRDQRGEVASIPREQWGNLLCAVTDMMHRHDVCSNPMTRCTSPTP